VFYPVNVTNMKTPGECWVTFPDLPGVMGVGSTQDEAMDRAEAALYDCLEGLMDNHQPIPGPKRYTGLGFELDEEFSARLAAYIAG
jgi:predicted RNase H-like HicB family nuclease